MDNLTIVCPTAGYPGLAKSLYSYRKYAKGARIIVIDQAPDGALSRSEVSELTDLYIKTYRALGFSKAMNLGITLSDREFVCCANDDVELIHEKWWEGVMHWFDVPPPESGRRIGAVNPGSIKGYKTEPDHLPYKDVYTDEDWAYLISKRELEGDPCSPIEPTKAIDGVMTWFTVFHRNALELIVDNYCYFDERFYPGGGEDYDLMCRFYDKGFRALGVFNTWAYHHWFGSRVEGSDTKYFNSMNEKRPEIIKELCWNNLDGPGGKWYVDGKSNWGLWGRKEKSIPTPHCTRVAL